MDLRPQSNYRFGCSQAQTPKAAKTKRNNKPGGGASNSGSKGGLQSDIRRFCVPGIKNTSFNTQASSSSPSSVQGSTSSSREGGDDVRSDILCSQLNLGKSGTSRDWFNFHPSKIQLLQEPPCRGGGVAMKH